MVHDEGQALDHLETEGDLPPEFAAVHAELQRQHAAPEGRHAVVPAPLVLVSLTLGVAAANRDPSVFEEPDRFDLDRVNKGTLTFGFGMHFCVGAHLARAEMATALDVLLERIDDIELPTNTARDGKWRKVEIKVKRPASERLTLRTMGPDTDEA